MSNVSSFALAYLINSSWQVPLLLGAALLAARLLNKVSAAVTHRMWVIALWLQVVLPALSSVSSPWTSHALSLIFREGTVDSGVRIVWSQADIGSEWIHLPHWAGVLTLWLYGAVTLFFLLRLIYGLRAASILAGRARPVLLTSDAATCWNRCSSHFSIRGAQIRSLPDLFGPVTLGLDQAMVILPETLLDQVSPLILQAVFAHECAHIRRQDFIKNILNEVISLPLRYHPMFTITRAYVVESREMVCDAMAANAAGGWDHYARSLVRLASMLNQQQVHLSHAIGLFDANSFERRITMLENQIRTSSSTRSKLVATCFAMALASCAAGLSFALKPAGTPMATMIAAGSPVRVSGEVMAGNAYKKVMPIYPPDAKQAKVQGAVVLHAVITPEGKVVDLSVISGPEALRQSSLDAVKQWEYKPFLLNGVPVDVETTVTVTYSIGQ